MKNFIIAFRTELIKLKRSVILPATLIFFVFVPSMMALLMWVARNPDAALKLGMVGTKASLFGQSDWKGYMQLLLQGLASVGMIGFGFVAAWVFGREYMDNTMKDMLALPVSRSAIVMAKFALVIIWSILLTIIMYLAGIAMGFAVGVQGWGDASFSAFSITFLLVAFLTILVSSPVAFFACYGQGIVAPISVVIIALIIANFAGLVGVGPWFPWAIPGLLTVAEPTAGMILTPASFVILGLTSAAGVAGTLLWWRFADHK